MVTADGHAIAQTAQTQRCFEVRNALVSVRGIVTVTANWRSRLASFRPVISDALVRDHGLPVYGRGNLTAHRVFCQPNRSCCAHRLTPIFLALATSFTARCTTGASIIFDPRLTTPNPLTCASS